MTDKERIENAIRHIKTAVDVDPWAMEIAVVAMKKMIPQKPEKRTASTWDPYLKTALCPNCGVSMSIVFWKFYDGLRMEKKITYCDTCGQAIDWEGWNWYEWGK